MKTPYEGTKKEFVVFANFTDLTAHNVVTLRSALHRALRHLKSEIDSAITDCDFARAAFCEVEYSKTKELINTLFSVAENGNPSDNSTQYCGEIDSAAESVRYAVSLEVLIKGWEL